MKSRRKLLERIYDILEDIYGPQKCFLHHYGPFQLLVATILSAQCTDKRVNIVTPAVFKKYPDVSSMAKADVSDLKELIRSTGFFRNKSANIIASSKAIVKDFDGKVPSNMKDLVSLPGIGRKTANVILGDAFGVPGFPVDTHVQRLLNRIGIVESDNPVNIEKIVNENLPENLWTEFSHLLIVHGRSRCTARKPDCPNCEINSICEKKI